MLHSLFKSEIPILVIQLVQSYMYNVPETKGGNQAQDESLLASICPFNCTIYTYYFFLIPQIYDSYETSTQAFFETQANMEYVEDIVSFIVIYCYTDMLTSDD